MFKEIDSYEIKNRGKIIVVESNDNMDNNFLVGKEVDIDGEKHLVKAVSTFCIKGVKKGDKIGLLI